MRPQPRDDRRAATPGAAARFLASQLCKLRLEAAFRRRTSPSGAPPPPQQVARYEQGENGIDAARPFLLAEAVGAALLERIRAALGSATWPRPGATDG